MSVAEKCSCIDPAHPQLSVTRQCELIGLPRSSYYRQSLSATESEESLALMRLMGLVSVAPKPNTSRPAPGHKIYPYLLRGLSIGNH